MARAEVSWIEDIGGKISDAGANLAAQPYAQIVVIVACIAWFVLKLPTEVLTAALSILAITLTQMVLAQQKEREAIAHQRDVAMHAKLDELVIASKDARDDVAGIEELSENEIIELRQQRAARSNGDHATA